MAHPVDWLTITNATREEVISLLESDIIAFASFAELTLSGEDGVTVGGKLLVRRDSPASSKFWLKGSFQVKIEEVNRATYVEVMLESDDMFVPRAIMPNIAKVFNDWRAKARADKISIQEEEYLNLKRR